MATSIAFLGATGAVGKEVLNHLLTISEVEKITVFGRNDVKIQNKKITFHKIDIHQPEMYDELIKNYSAAICTLGVGQPSKVSREEFIRTDKEAVLNFAKKCKKQGVHHFELLASVGINSNSKSLYLRTKGELVDELKKLEFKRLSIFEPSMILTPTNRYGFVKGVLYKIWPKLHFFLQGKAKKYRGIEVEQLGKAMALKLFSENYQLFEELTWDDFHLINKI